MNSQTDIYDINFSKGYGKLFSNTQCDFEKLIDLISDFSRIKIDNLYEIQDQWENLLIKWQPITNMSDEKINLLKNGFKIRVNKLKKHIEQNVLTKDKVKKIKK